MMNPKFDAAELQTVTGGHWIGNGVAVCGVYSDTRNPVPGALFAALRGERFDGHDHLAEAIANGAAAVLIDATRCEKFDPSSGVPALAVPDVIAALQKLARYHRDRFPQLRVIGVTGSVGKTSVKEMLRAICVAAAGSDAVLATEGNTNNQIGVPQNLFRLHAGHRFAVIELGTNHPGEIAPLAATARPDAAVVNTIAPCHLEFLGDLAGVAREKAEIYGPSTIAVVPLDTPESTILRQAAAGKTVLTFGDAPEADVRACGYTGDLRGGSFDLVFPDGDRRRVEWKLTGAHQARNAAGAAAAALALGISPGIIVRGLAGTTLPGMRMKIEDRDGVRWCNDAYNASPSGVEAVLRQFAETVPSERLILVLGDMLELGTAEADLHRQTLRRARELLPHARILAVGPRLTAAVRELGLSNSRCVPDAAFAAVELDDWVRNGDTVLLKGSRGMRLERALPPARTAFTRAAEFTGLLADQTVRSTGFADFTVRDLSEDSRRIGPGDIFFAMPGAKFDGAAYIAEAVRRGARLVVGTGDAPPLPEGVGYLQIRDPYRALARAFQAYFGFPDRALRLHAVTGTNGKTTTALVLHRLAPSGGLIGTVEYRIGNASVPADRTTPPARRLFRMLRSMVEAGCRDVFMELSSHALDQNRTGDCRFSTAIFTNLTGDHLDYHKDRAHYQAAKRRLFADLMAEDGTRVFNFDDEVGRAWYAEFGGIAFGETADAPVRLIPASATAGGSRFRLGETEWETTLIGDYNLHNLAGVILAARAAGFGDDAIRDAIRAPYIPGRLETVKLSSGAVAVIDYAHTDDALRNVLGALRPLCARRLIAVFGAGGDRDRTKRPRMGRAVADLADAGIVTSDNPRSERPESILEEIIAGAPEFFWTVEPDRGRAIGRALADAHAGDVILIAGKGHETTQEFADRTVHFSDRETVENHQKEKP